MQSRTHFWHIEKYCRDNSLHRKPHQAFKIEHSQAEERLAAEIEDHKATRDTLAVAEASMRESIRAHDATRNGLSLATAAHEMTRKAHEENLNQANSAHEATKKKLSELIESSEASAVKLAEMEKRLAEEVLRAQQAAKDGEDTLAQLSAAEQRTRGERDVAMEKCKELKTALAVCESRLDKLGEMQKRLDDKDEQVKDALKTVERVQDVQMSRSKELSEERDKLASEVSSLRADLKHETAMRHEREQVGRAEADALKEELQRVKTQHLEAGLRRQEQDMRLEIERVAQSALREELESMKVRVETITKAKTEAGEKLAVMDAEYRMYKSLCESKSPSDIKERLTSLVSLEAERARAGCQAEAAAEETAAKGELVAKLRAQVIRIRMRPSL